MSTATLNTSTAVRPSPAFLSLDASLFAAASDSPVAPSSFNTSAGFASFWSTASAAQNPMPSFASERWQEASDKSFNHAQSLLGGAQDWKVPERDRAQETLNTTEPARDHVQEKLSTTELFAGKTAVVFSVPGAFTPTCSAKHLPGFIHHADKFFDKGVDRIVCMAVNDAFVMKEWGDQAGVGNKIMMLADGNADFTKALGLELDGSGFGMGIRSQRFALVINDGKVTDVQVDDGGAFEVSSAEYMLNRL